MKILIPDVNTLVKDNDVSLEIFDSLADIVVLYSNITKKELLDEIVDTDIVLCNKVVIDKEVMSCSKKLKYIGTFATGYNNIDIDFAKEKGITVCNAPEYSTNAVAQQVFGYILAHYTKISQYDTFVKQGGWVASPTFSPFVFNSLELAGKTLGIVGFGSIGEAVAKIALSFNMQVLSFTRTPKNYDGVKFCDFETLLKKSDIITLHCPLTDATRELMNENTFNLCKDGAFFINTSRGGTISEIALKNALESGKLSGAAVDVLTVEPMDKDCPLLNAPNIIITPHTAWAPLETRERLIKLVADNLKAFLSGKPQNVVF